MRSNITIVLFCFVPWLKNVWWKSIKRKTSWTVHQVATRGLVIQPSHLKTVNFELYGRNKQLVGKRFTSAYLITLNLIFLYLIFTFCIENNHLTVFIKGFNGNFQLFLDHFLEKLNFFDVIYIFFSLHDFCHLSDWLETLSLSFCLNPPVRSFLSSIFFLNFLQWLWMHEFLLTYKVLNC